MKSIIPYIVIFIIGIAAGMCLCRSFFPRMEVDVQKDTVVTYKTKYYSKLDLQHHTYKLDVPKLSTKEYVYINDTTTIYNENVKYLAAPRQYFRTSIDDAEIFHSGIDSRIDSLKLYVKTKTITEYIQPIKKPHMLTLGIEAHYSTMFRLPLKLKYSYEVNDWLSVFGYGEYELLHKKFGAGAGTNIFFRW